MNRLTKLPLALAFGGAMALGATSAAQADVMAGAVAQLSNFEIHSHSSGLILDFNTDFAFGPTFTSKGGYDGTVNGSSVYNTSQTAAPVDLPVVCVGNGCAGVGGWNAAYGAENSFTHMSAPPVGTYTAADQQEAGAPIANLPIPGGGGATFPNPATIANGAYAAMIDGANGDRHANSFNELTSSFVFTLNQSQGLDFNFDYSVFLQAYVSGSENFPAKASASFLQEFTLTDLTPVTGGAIWTINSGGSGPNGTCTAQDINPTTGCVQTVGLNAPLPFSVETIQQGAATYSFQTPVLNAGTLYQLSARTIASADVQRIPEPGELALLGIGLIGMTLVMARRRNQNNQNQMGAI